MIVILKYFFKYYTSWYMQRSLWGYTKIFLIKIVSAYFQFKPLDSLSDVLIFFASNIQSTYYNKLLSFDLSRVLYYFDFIAVFVLLLNGNENKIDYYYCHNFYETWHLVTWKYNLFSPDLDLRWPYWLD